MNPPLPLGLTSDIIVSLIDNRSPETIPMDHEVKAMLEAAPTTPDGGEFVLFEGKDQFIGQFKTGAEAAACAKEHQLKRPTLLTLSALKRRSYAYLDGVLYEW